MRPTGDYNICAEEASVMIKSHRTIHSPLLYVHHTPPWSGSRNFKT